MLRNYLITALRNLVRNRLYAAINIIGLTIGFSAALLIGLFVRDELTHDTWLPGYENVYRVATTASPPNGQATKTDAAGPAQAAWLKLGIPEISAIARLWPEIRGLRSDVAETNETVVWADPEVFEVFPFPVVEGDLATALQQPNAIVITRDIARKYFGDDHAVGKTLEIDRKTSMHVTAVLESLPSRSHLDIKIIASGLSSASPFATPYRDAEGFGPVFNYLRIAPGTLEAVERALPGVIDSHINMKVYADAGMVGPGVKASDVFVFDLQPLPDIHMLSQSGRYAADHFGMLRPSGDPAMVAALSVTAITILLVAVANFVNLMTARGGRRAVEVGVRKTSGAQKRDLIVQFIGEAFLYLVISFILALTLAITILPSFNAFLGREIAVDIAYDKALIFAALGGLLATSIGAGLYPAVALSAFRPAMVLKIGARGAVGLGWLRQALVIAQFAILIALIIATAVIGRQTTFAMTENFRVDRDQLLFVNTPCDANFKGQVAALPGVRGVACATNAILGSAGGVGLTFRPDGTQFNMTYVGVEAGLLELLGLKPLAGRFFDADNPKSRGVVINESAVRAFHFASAEAAIGQTNGPKGPEIIGVAPDFPIRDLHDPVEATAFNRPGKFTHVFIKLDGNRAGETLRGIDEAWERLGTGRPIARQFYNQHVQAQYLDIARQTQAFTAFSWAAVLIACLGLFGLSAYTAEQRTKEIGVRKSMGARTEDVLRLLLWQFVKPVLWANVIAWPVGYFAMRRWLESFAYRIDLSPWIFLSASALAFAVAVATVAGHAMLIARAQPVQALRHE